tara:strand:- start:1342 stop:1557 length:216 start_codon:yes stop_codon:yes gene_type:complete
MDKNNKKKEIPLHNNQRYNWFVELEETNINNITNKIKTITINNSEYVNPEYINEEYIHPETGEENPNLIYD